MIDAATTLYCIFGNPVRHSLSPAMHNAAFKYKKINSAYAAFSVNSIADAVEAMRALGIKGASVTIPHKIDVMKHIDEIDPAAERIGSVNTLKNIDGKISGYNTDGIGAVVALSAAGFNPAGSRALVIGNGGSARAVAFSLLDSGAEVMLTGRNISNVQLLCNDLKKYYPGAGIIPDSEISKQSLSKFDTVINTTPLGMTPKTDATPLSAYFFSERQIVFDIVYNPDETRFLREAAAAGCRTVRGIEMLLHQGAAQFKIWTGEDAPVDVMRNALSEARTQSA